MAKKIVALAGAFLLILGMTYVFMPATETIKYESTDQVLQNPMTGFAASADYPELAENCSLVYIDTTWKNIEPEEGVYDFRALEEENNLEEWRSQGKQVVFRLICDKPGEEEHMDIPQWLYDATGDGEFYDISYGKGYAPNYSNTFFREAHRKLLEALGERYGRDQFFYFVELGSLGHWGEWHVKSDEDLPGIPSEDICAEYVQDYVDAFPNANLLMRRPYTFVSDNQMGIYNDMTGDPTDTLEWLDWQNNGGSYDTQDTHLEYEVCPNIWEKSPIGGEFTSGITMEELLNTNIGDTLELLRQSHMSFIGPKIPDPEVQVQYAKNVDEVLKLVGYRYGVSQLSIRKNKVSSKAELTMTIDNNGTAPTYEDWDVNIYLLDESGNVINKIPVDVDLTYLYGGESVDVSLSVDMGSGEEKVKSIAIAVEREVEPSTMNLDLKAESLNGAYILWEQ